MLQPLGAACYFGSAGNELQGMLATSLFKSLRDCRSEPSKFKDTYYSEACNILKEYQDEILKLQETCYVYDNISNTFMHDCSIPRQHLNWARVRFIFFSRYGTDIMRKIGDFKKNDLYAILDEVMKSQEKLGTVSANRRKSIKEKNLLSTSKTRTE